MQLMDWAWRCAAPARSFAHHAARRVAHHPAIGAFVRHVAYRVAPPHVSAAGAACRWVALAGALGGAAVAPFVGGGGAEPAAAPAGGGPGFPGSGFAAASGGGASGGDFGGGGLSGAGSGGAAASGPTRPAFVGPDVLPLVTEQGVAPDVAPTLRPTAPADAPDAPAPSDAKTLIPEAGMLGTFLAVALALAWHVRRGGARLRTAPRTAPRRTSRR